MDTEGESRKARATDLLHEGTVARLAFIRYLYSTAQEQAAKPQPMDAASILTFHDAVEQFLILSCEHKDVETTAKTDFMAYWSKLSPVLAPDGLTQKKSMERLNRARVGLKHGGIRPSREDVHTLRYAATLFFEENTLAVFGIGFDKISMLGLVKLRSVREELENAQTFREQGNLREAVGRVAVAFYHLLSSRHQRDPLVAGLEWPTGSPKPSGYRYGGGMMSARGSQPNAKDRDGFAREKIGKILEQTDALRRAVSPMQQAMVALALGVEYARYRRFIEWTPSLTVTGRGRLHTTPTPRWNGVRPSTLNESTYQYCFDFVVETALRPNIVR